MPIHFLPQSGRAKRGSATRLPRHPGKLFKARGMPLKPGMQTRSRPAQHATKLPLMLLWSQRPIDDNSRFLQKRSFTCPYSFYDGGGKRVSAFPSRFPGVPPGEALRASPASRRGKLTLPRPPARASPASGPGFPGLRPLGIDSHLCKLVYRSSKVAQ